VEDNNVAKNQFQWGDLLGPLPPTTIRVRLEDSELLLGHYVNRQWIAIARRENRRWTPLIGNIRIEQSGDAITVSPE
jgi:hypothetical protein